MRSRILPAVGLSVIALAVATTFAPMASAHNTGVGAAGKTASGALVHTKPAAGTCYSQRDNDNGVGIVSQDFEASFDIYDSQGADDFKIKRACKMKDVDVDGLYFNGAGPATCIHVTIYKNKKKPPKSKPGAIVKDFPCLSYTDTTGTGSFDVPLGATLSLAPGTYWVSVQAVMDFSTGGEWGWNTNNTVRLDPAKWRNPGDGFATGCVKYTTLTTCIAASEGGDFSFAISK